MNRRNFVGTTAALGAAFQAKAQQQRATAHWPNGARLIVSLSMQLETGAQPERGANGPWGQLDTRYPDLVTEKWYEYGFKEGIPRLLELFARRKVQITSHMVGLAVEKHPALAREIVDRGHEAAAHGQVWGNHYDKTPAEERASYEANVAAVLAATGKRPVGFNAPGMRATPATFGILQDLGFVYHTDDLSRDEPFLINVRNKPFVAIPYTFVLNDYQNFENRWRTCADFAGELKAEFDALYAEGARKRRMVSIATHDRVARPSRAAVIDEFIGYAQRHPGVVFMRKDEIAKMALEDAATIREGI
jgi:peptidoglycan/xylan/chitin deacetylase (PgdA/CDA1 family)